MMAAIFLVLAVVDAALLANVALANTSTGSVSVFGQSITGYTQGELLLLAAGLGLLLVLFLGYCREFVQRTAGQASGAAGGATRGGGQGRRAGARERASPQGTGGHAAPRCAGGAARSIQRGTVSHP
jgi:uncharacterized membrane protein YgcG